jgi:hypothetical protein
MAPLSSAPEPVIRPPLKIWWAIWTGILVSLAVIWWNFGFLKLLGNEPHANPAIDLAGMAPLFVSIVLRWLVLPRVRVLRMAFIFFVTGVALAEGCGLLGIFLGGPYRDEMFLLGMLGIAQYMPFFARGLAQPRPQGFIPNN